MPSANNFLWHLALLASASWRTASFRHPVPPPHFNHAGIGNDVIAVDGRPDCCEYRNVTAQNGRCRGLSGSSSVPVHTSRRKFVQAAAASSVGIAGIPTALAAVGTEAAGGAPSLTSDGRSIVSVPGPLAPFSTTRTYRNLVLSNGLRVVLVKDTMAQRSSVALSIDGAGQFAEPPEIPGLAHLMEHVVLSSTRARQGQGRRRAAETRAGRSRRALDGYRFEGTEGGGGDEADGGEDFEDWLADNEGDSNAFTAPGFVCFHFNGPHEILPEGLERFSRLFTLDEVETTIVQKPWVLPREIGRVNDELDRTSDASRAFYFLKRNINPEHPFARFSAGSRATLQTTPAEKGIDVASWLLFFFRDHYLASKATLVVVGKAELGAMDRWISPFSNVMAQKSSQKALDPSFPQPIPPPMPSVGKDRKQTIILRSKDDAQIDENSPTLCMEWPLSLAYGTPYVEYQQSPVQDYVEYQQPLVQNVITPPALGFVLLQILSRRGPGSLTYFLRNLGWVPKTGSKGVPRITFPVDVSGFQILRMEISLSLDGFSNRSAVLSAVFESIRKVIERPLQVDLIKQYLAAGFLHGYLFAPRPADAITLAVDSLRFGTGAIGNTDFGWYLMPAPEDEVGVEKMRDVVQATLEVMSDDKAPLVSFRASPKAVFGSAGGIVDQKISIPPLFLPWKAEPVTGVRYLVETRANGASSYLKSLMWYAARFEGAELLPPYLNPLIPTRFRPPRPVMEKRAGWGGIRSLFLEDASAYEAGGGRRSSVGTWGDPQTTGFRDDEGSNWRTWQIPPDKQKTIGLPLPVRPPEPSVECAFVVQLLSSIPSTFTSAQLALSNLWLLSFDDEVQDLAELGAVAGAAYETSMNTAGLRLSFRGVSQTLPSYVRRLCRRLIQHHTKLLDGSTKISQSVYQQAISNAERSLKISPQQKQQVIDATRQASEKDVAKQGLFFLRCTSGGCFVSQGDVLPDESAALLSDLRRIFRDFGRVEGFAAAPDLRDLLYRPFWKPRDASPCLLPGICLISVACGRVPR